MHATQRVLVSAAAAEAARLSEQAGQEQDVAMTWEAVEGHPAAALLGVAADVRVLVVGTCGRGGLVGSLPGSVSQHVVAHARYPVVVIPDPQRSHGAAGHDRTRSLKPGARS
jgi:nucleotide-binding universal stress UspA family protein